MRFEYIIYPSAEKQLDSSGLNDKIKQAHKEFKIYLTHHMIESEIVNIVKCMKRERMFDSMPMKERRDFSEKLNDVWKKRDSAGWIVDRNGESDKEALDLQDFLLFIGWNASKILPKKDLFNYRKFGFSSLNEFTGTLGAAIENELHYNPYHRGLKWVTSRPDGRVFENEISGDTNCDLRINQRDITPYETTDPFDVKVNYRPETDPDRRNIAAYRSNEGAFLTTILKYADQLQLNSQTLKDQAKDTIEWAKSLGQGGETCAEHFGGFDQSARNFLINFYMPIPKLDSADSTSEHTLHGLTTAVDGHYEIYIDKNDELVLAYVPLSENSPKKKIQASFLPQEVDHLVNGLLYQSAKGLGRTSVKQLIDILEYRFSKDFPKDLK